MRTYYNHFELSKLTGLFGRAQELNAILEADKAFRPVASLWAKIQEVQQGYEPGRDDDQARLPLDQVLKDLAAEFEQAVRTYRAGAFRDRMPAHNAELKARARELDSQALDALQIAWDAIQERRQVGEAIRTAGDVWVAISEECAGADGVYLVGEQSGLPGFVRDGRVNLWEAYTSHFGENVPARASVDQFTARVSTRRR